jgi:radical SAM protein with 4Fe4S-binding SPASM domain
VENNVLEQSLEGKAGGNMESSKRSADASLEVYPRLCADVLSIHFNPGTSVITRRRIANEPNPTSFLSALLGDEICEFVNMTAAQLLAASDGSRTVRAIADSLCTAGDRAEFAAKSAAFFQTGAERKFIDLLDAPGPRAASIRITGSTEYFTPIHISVEMTNRCNLRCSYCYNSFLENEERLTTQELLRTLQEWRELGLLSLELTGGEPLLHEGFWEVLEYCYKTFRSVALLTNGTLITEEKARRLASYRKKLMVAISMDGGTAESHEAVRGAKTFDRTVAAIRWLKQGGLAIRLGMSLTPQNSYDLLRAAELARDLDVDFFQMAPVLSYGRGREANLGWVHEEVHAMHRLVEQAQKDYADLVPRYPKAKLAQMEGAFGNCGLGHKNVVLTPSGKLKACAFLREADFIGDVRKERLIDIFRKPIIEKFRDIRNPSPDRCGDCKYVRYCAGCTARALLILEEEKRLCEWAHAFSINECFPRYDAYSYDPARPRF